MASTHSEELTARVRDLWRAVTVLTVIALEDRPPSVDLIAVDDLCDRICDLQGLVHQLREAGRSVDPVGSLEATGELLDQVACTYWRDLRAGRAFLELTLGDRRRSEELDAWSHCLDVALTECEEPLLQAAGASRRACTQMLRGRHKEPVSLLQQDNTTSNNPTVEVGR